MRKLGRKKAHRDHTIRNLASSLLLYEAIETTEAKAKEIKAFVNRLLSRSKGSDFNTIRKLSSVLFDRNSVAKVVEELNPRYENRASGFVRSYHLKNRLGDNASMMRLELIDRKVFVKKTKANSASDTASSTVMLKEKTKIKDSTKDDENK